MFSIPQPNLIYQWTVFHSVTIRIAFHSVAIVHAISACAYDWWDMATSQSSNHVATRNHDYITNGPES